MEERNMVIIRGLRMIKMIMVFMIIFLTFHNAGLIEAKELGTLNFSTQWEAESLDPAQVGAVESLNAIGPFYEPLVTFEGESMTEFAPCLATSWETSKDGKTITFHLRKGVKFHDGTELTADDVKYSFERVIRTSVQPPGRRLAELASVDDMVATDKYTLVLRLKTATQRIYPMLTNPMGFGVVSKNYVKKHSTEGDPYGLNWMRSNVMGTGPWKLERWTVNEKLVMNRNGEYWGEKGHFDKLVINVIRDTTVAQMMLEKGDLDIATKLRLDQYSTLEHVKGITVKNYPTIKTGYIRINCSKKPLDDLRVRQALNYAINYDELIKYVEKGRGFRLYTTIPKGMLGWNPDVKPKYNYDPKKAMGLLKEAGLDKGLEINVLYSPDRHAQFEDMAPYIVSYLNGIGIKAKAQKVAFTTQLAMMKKRDYDIAFDTWTPYYPDPASNAIYYYNSKHWKEGGWSFAFWENKRVDELLDKAMDNLNVAERDRQYREVDQIITENAVAINLNQISEVIAVRDDIKNVEWHPTLWFKQFNSIYSK